jgi:lysophospholipase L1-like esterase
LYKFEEPIKGISYSNGLVINIVQEDYIKYHINLKKNLKVLCEKLNIKFIDLTNEMKIESKQKLLIGPEDFGHYNIEGNQFIAKIINSKLN